MAMRLWYQLLSSEIAMKDFLATLQAHCNDAAAPGTAVEVHGTRKEALGDQFSFLRHYSTTEVIENALRVRRDGTYDAFVLANSLDPGLEAMRELLEIPVVSMLEVVCAAACSMGETFGVVAPIKGLVPTYRALIAGYGLHDRLAAVDSIDFELPAQRNAMFTDPRIGQLAETQFVATARRVLDQGAEALFATGSAMMFAASRGIFQIDGAPVIDGYRLLVKAAEAAVAMHRQTGVCVSRRGRYGPPSRDLLRRAAEIYGLDDLRDG